MCESHKHRLEEFLLLWVFDRDDQWKGSDLHPDQCCDDDDDPCLHWTEAAPFTNNGLTS